jgi:hypothetical protein
MKGVFNRLCKGVLKGEKYERILHPLLAQACYSRLQDISAINLQTYRYDRFLVRLPIHSTYQENVQT